ncbi:hypothetical protein DFH09DRAFT_1254651 [Mycena vulgaris]|nr:hypothetical protein DFH09DRAFT_1254651 [Mycena vulgaris]
MDIDDDFEATAMDVDVPSPDSEGVSVSETDSVGDTGKTCREDFLGAAKTSGGGKLFLDKFHDDQHTDKRAENLYYPFATVEEWELLVSWLTRANLSIAATNEFLRLWLDLRSHIEILPKGPRWKAKSWKALSPSLLQNPLIQDHIHYTPFRLFTTAAWTMRVYTKWLSSNVAWEMQEQLPKGATVIGTIVSTDKTQITVMTGNRVAHPLLISAANIDMDFRMKASHHAFLLGAMIPIAKFKEKNNDIRGVLQRRLYHACLDFVFAPLKKAAQVGVMLSDTFGRREEVEEAAHPWEFPRYLKIAKKRGLNGVHRPYWMDCPLSDPSRFLTPEILHHWFKFAWDYELQWAILVLSEDEIDFQFSVTGREHQDMQRYLVAAIAGAQDIPRGFLIAAPKIDEDVLNKMDAALKTFHENKHAILEAGVRRGKNGPIDNWWIPKLEFMQSVVPSIRANGVPLQWSADMTEHAHITLIKDPASHSNNQNHEQQICRYLDRRDKVAQFDLATAIEHAGVELDADPDDDEEDDDAPILVNTTVGLLEQIEPMARLGGSGRRLVNYFTLGEQLFRGEFPNAPKPFRMFASSQGNTAFHLAVDVASDIFKLPDLKPALLAYLHRVSQGMTLNSVAVAQQSSPTWEFGRGDGVIVNTDPQHTWPRHTVGHLRMIMRAPGINKFLAYVQRFDIEGPVPIVTRAWRTNGIVMGDIIPLDQLRAHVELTPQFGKQADRRLTKENSLDYSEEFWLTKYFTKELFFALSQ